MVLAHATTLGEGSAPQRSATSGISQSGDGAIGVPFAWPMAHACVTARALSCRPNAHVFHYLGISPLYMRPGTQLYFWLLTTPLISRVLHS